jgi:hypothetical protein
VLERVGTLDLGNDEGLLANRLGGGAHGFDVRGGLHERLTQGVHPRLESKFQTSPVVVGKRADAQISDISW